MVTYGEAKRILSQYAGRAGKCPSSGDVDLFVREALQYLLISGQHGNLRKFCFNAVKGCITAPYELETPLHVKVEGSVGTVWSKWFEFYNYGELDGCVPASNSLSEDPNTYPTVYDIPSGGARVGALATACEAEGAFLIVHGLDNSGRDVITNHQGEQLQGEYLRLRQGELRYTQVEFSKVTKVEKSHTNGYVQLTWVRPAYNQKGFLADYSPLETTPAYRRFKLTTPNCGPSVKVAVIGRIRIKDKYADNDILPFENLYTLSLAGQALNAQYNNDVQTAVAKDATMQDIIARENEYKRVQNGQPLDVFYPLSMGSVKNIV